jgi:UDP-N-acetyl-D-glucosamine dehydrogenase
MDLSQKSESRQAVVGVVGLGYVGLPLGQVFCEAGYPVLGFDVDAGKVSKIEAGENYLKHLGEDFVSGMNATGRFSATSDFGRLSEADAVLLCVPTPLGEHDEPDLSYVLQTVEAVAKTLRPGQLIVLESTTYPSTTRAEMLPLLEATGLKCGQDFYVAYSPEREDPGAQSPDTQRIPKLVGGIDPISGELATALYRGAFDEVVPVSSAEVAESAKLLENIYRAVNIAMVNEMKVLLTAMDIDVWEVIDAAATKPFGFQPFYPGPGLGGHCIPIDPFYLTWKAKEVGLPTRFIELAGEVNNGMPEYVVQRTALALNDRKKAINGSRVLVLGLAYKPDVDDVRESPALELIVKLRDLGAEVDYSDPHVPSTHKMRHYDLKMSSVELTDETLAGYDCVVVATHHAAFDWQRIADKAQLIVDTRGALREVAGDRDHIVGA